MDNKKVRKVRKTVSISNDFEGYGHTLDIAAALPTAPTTPMELGTVV